ncbi:hypothetical protein FGO68_gene8723 [Halteria grandinella]|uniref:Uncharacterized protein n=1 Tax=Halteria grandinella TaxID=5974 RepID=A0A8J8SYD4_HALGN|nr:hypothetical protein FGO68_gene8723 [Halteria grandinella]
MDNLRLLGWNVNGQDYDGRTALGVAASQGQLEAVKYLISKGADLTIRDGRGNDPLDDARREGRTSVIDYLINEALIWVTSGALGTGMSQHLRRRQIRSPTAPLFCHRQSVSLKSFSPSKSSTYTKWWISSLQLYRQLIRNITMATTSSPRQCSTRSLPSSSQR